jgi:hypothetical protein
MAGNLKSAKALLKEPIANITGTKLLNGALWGIEFENELDEDVRLSAVKQHLAMSLGFNITRDGSLRGTGYEFVSRPLELAAMKSAVEALCTALAPEKWSYSRRTSTHIHINFADKKGPDLLKFLAVYWIMEPCLFLLVKPHRVGNTFCVPTTTTRDTLITELSRDYTIRSIAAEDHYKYESLNLSPLFKYGTAECRIFHSSFNAKEVNGWLDILNGIVKFSERCKDLAEVRQRFIELTPQAFFKQVVGDLADRFDGPVEALLRRGFRDAAPIFKMHLKLKEIEGFIVAEEEKQRRQLELVKEHLKTDRDLLMYLNEPAPPVEPAVRFPWEVANIGVVVDAAPIQWRVYDMPVAAFDQPEVGWHNIEEDNEEF